MRWKKDARVQELEQQLTEVRGDLADRDRIIVQLEAVAADLREASGADEVGHLRAQLEAANGNIREAVSRYREVRLANMPDIPEVLVPQSARIAEVDMHFEAAERIVAQVRSNLEGGDKAGGRRATPPWRYPDMDSLSAAEKIRIGLQQRAEREAAERG